MLGFWVVKQDGTARYGYVVNSDGHFVDADGLGDSALDLAKLHADLAPGCIIGPSCQPGPITMVGSEESGGGKLKGNHYYRVDVRQPISDELQPYSAECADIIEALEMSFNEGEAFKALWRLAAARQGNGKPNANPVYDADKVAHYGGRVQVCTRRELDFE